jgi:hypothetical protein
VKILFVLMVLVTFLGIADVVYVVYKKAFYPPPFPIFILDAKEYYSNFRRCNAGINNL